jgi:cell division transport system permease protein
MDRIKSVFRNTFKHISRSGWLGLASISVMTLAFLLSTIFAFLAYTSNLFLQSVEQEPQIYIFFEIGTEEDKIHEIQNNLESNQEIAYVDYTSEEQAKQEFYEAQKDVNELAAEAVSERNLPASLAIRLNSLENAEEIDNLVNNLKEHNPEIKTVLYSKEIVENIREVFLWLRIGGGIILALSFIVIILFTLLTVEFRTHSRSKEIEIMQLVGGSLGYIRMPFILEGAIYGVVGAFISNLIITGLIAVVYHQINNDKLNYLRTMLGSLSWPELNIGHFLLAFFFIIFLSGLLGAVNSFIAIRRYIK